MNRIDELKSELNTKEIKLFLKYEDDLNLLNAMKKLNEIYNSVDTHNILINKLIPDLKDDEEYIFYSYRNLLNKKMIEIIFYTQDDTLKYIYNKFLNILNANKYYYFLYQPHEGIFETNDIQGNMIHYNKVIRLHDSCSFDSCLPMPEDMLDALDNVCEIYDIYCYDDKNIRRSVEEVRRDLEK